MNSQSILKTSKFFQTCKKNENGKRKSVSFSQCEVKYFNKKQTPMQINNTIESNNIEYTYTQPKVKLINVYYIKSHLQGKIWCKNLDFKKRLQLKLTMDNWQNSMLLNHGFKYIQSIGDYDEFVFDIVLPLQGQIEFVINYKVDNNTYWDNNNGLNYILSIGQDQVYVEPFIKIAPSTAPVTKYSDDYYFSSNYTYTTREISTYRNDNSQFSYKSFTPPYTVLDSIQELEVEMFDDVEDVDDFEIDENFSFNYQLVYT